MDQIEIRKFDETDRDWVIDQHGDHYAQVEGFDASFKVLVAQILDDFIENHDPNTKAGWIAWQGAERLGSIFCVGIDAQTAKLRLFLLTPESRGRGLGGQMLNHCMGFARENGYRQMKLWTHESHRAAGALYAKTGWELTSSKPVVSFGQALVEQHWQIVL